MGNIQKFRYFIGISCVAFLIFISARTHDFNWLKVDKESQQSTQNSDGVDVLINTYMRSGSTFLGSILGFREDTFYLYEPLFKTMKWKYHKEPDMVCAYRTPKCEVSQGALNKSLQGLNDIYNCRLEESFFSTSLNTVKRAGPKWKYYHTCIKTLKGSISTCLAEIEKICRNSKNRVTKVLRMDLSVASSLLKYNPQLKIVQLLRDPRAVMSSRIQARFYPLKLNSIQSIKDDAKTLCSRMHDDIEVGRKLIKLYPERVKVVQYEDLNSSTKKAKLLYDFFKMQFSEGMLDFVEKMYGPDRDRNSAFAYRFTLPWDIVHLIDKQCKSVLENLGMTIYDSERDLLDRNINATSDNFPFEL